MSLRSCGLRHAIVHPNTRGAHITISGQTQTLPLFVEKQYQNFNLPGAFGASVLLALLALTTLLAMNLLKRKEDV